jgi:hypothetical protein
LTRPFGGTKYGASQARHRPKLNPQELIEEFVLP